MCTNNLECSQLICCALLLKLVSVSKDTLKNTPKSFCVVYQKSLCTAYSNVFHVKLFPA